MENESKLLKHLELVAQRVRYHHDALWEEEKHYTWWIYITFGGLIYIFVNDYLCSQWKMVLIILGCFFGFFISLTGYNVIRRESEYFHTALQIYARTVIALGLDKSMTPPNGSNPILLMPKKEIQEKDFESVESNANKSWNELLTSAFRRELGIRDAFQLTFFISVILFSLLIIAVIAHITFN